MKDTWGRFTVRGNHEVEAQIAALVEEVGRIVEGSLPASKYRALILIGGYGRGEGGVEVRDGRERPHNNLDFLLITEGLRAEDSSRLQTDLDGALLPLVDRHGVGLDISFLPARKLWTSPCLCMWYDMRFGHKTIAGDPNFMPSFTRFSVERILPSDMMWLLVNRGSQLLVNDILLQRGTPTQEEQRYIVRLAMKAIIGYGDALLFFLGRYHWSYQEKNLRLQACEGISEDFKKLYAEAVEFRFQPDYGPCLQRDLNQWMASLRGPLEQVHIQCETIRLRAPEWSWERYPSRCLRSQIAENALVPRTAAKMLVNLVRGPAAPAAIQGLDRLAGRAIGRRQVLLPCYPAAIYSVDCFPLRRWTQGALGARDTAIEELRYSFLEAWGNLVEPSFSKVANRFNLFSRSEGQHT